MLQNKVDGLIALFKIGVSRLESTFLWNGNYYSSHYDRILSGPKIASFNERLLNSIKSKVKQMENLFEQFTQEQVNLKKVFIYGDNIEDNFLKLLQNNMSVIAFRLNPLQNIEKSSNLQNALPSTGESTQYVEPIGVVLDQ